ncbi:MAG: DUF2059 domain-containing protein [Caulobacteraceae bacterium]
MNRNALAALAGLALVGASFAAFAQTPPPPAAAPPPSAETLALARAVAAHDDFLNLIGTMGLKQIAGVEKGLGDLTPAEKAKVDAIGEAKLVEGQNRVIDKLAAVYASRFSEAELRSMAAFLESPAGKAYSGRLLTTLMTIGEGMKGFDFKREVLAETCAQIHKGCAAAAPAKPSSPANPSGKE